MRWEASNIPLTDPDSLAVLHAQSRDDLSPEDAYNALEGLRSMAGRNVTAALDAHSAKLDAMRSELTVQRWLMGLGFAALVAAEIAQLFRG